MNTFIDIGSKIKEERKKKKLTQKEVAEKLKIPVSTYSNYENNNRVPSIETLEKIANILDISYKSLVNDFISITGEDLTKEVTCYDLKYRDNILEIINDISLNFAEIDYHVNVDILYLLSKVSRYLNDLLFLNETIEEENFNILELTNFIIGYKNEYISILKDLNKFYDAIISEKYNNEFIFDYEILNYKKNNK